MSSRVLVIDDDPGVLEVISSFLEDNQIDHVLSSNINEARFKMENEHFGLIICDFNIGKVSCTDLVVNLRANNSINYNTPIFLITAAIKKVQLNKLKPHLDAAFLKPFNMNSLLSRIEEFRGRKHQRKDFQR
jgi:DNA-binding response OmpR family regulator